MLWWISGVLNVVLYTTVYIKCTRLSRLALSIPARRRMNSPNIKLSVDTFLPSSSVLQTLRLATTRPSCAVQVCPHQSSLPPARKPNGVPDLRSSAAQSLLESAFSILPVSSSVVLNAVHRILVLVALGAGSCGHGVVLIIERRSWTALPLRRLLRHRS